MKRTEPTLKAIETSYCGYRFRSRLEARWAVFFDALGVRWEYEPQGFDLGPGLGAYLPDFWLPDLRRWVEVKPEGEGEVAGQRLYIAGKMGGIGGADRGCWRSSLLGGEHVDLAGDLASKGFRKHEFVIPWTPHVYVGPFKMDVDKHGWSPLSGGEAAPVLHGLESLNTGAAHAHDLPNPYVVFDNCRAAVERATVVFAWIDTPDCFGTLVEIGIANGLGIPVHVGFSSTLADGLRHDMWFIGQASRSWGVFDSASQAFDSLIRCKPWWVPDAGRKVEALAAQSRNPASLVKGDPASHYSRSDVPWLAQRDRRDAAALIARSARFEHGQTPGGRL